MTTLIETREPPAAWPGHDVTPADLLPEMPRLSMIGRILAALPVIGWYAARLDWVVAAHADAWTAAYGPGVLVWTSGPYRLLYVPAAAVPDPAVTAAARMAGHRQVLPLLVVDGDGRVLFHDVDLRRDGDAVASGTLIFIVPVRLRARGRYRGPSTRRGEADKAAREPDDDGGAE